MLSALFVYQGIPQIFLETATLQIPSYEAIHWIDDPTHQKNAPTHVEPRRSCVNELKARQCPTHPGFR